MAPVTYGESYSIVHAARYEGGNRDLDVEALETGDHHPDARSLRAGTRPVPLPNLKSNTEIPRD